MDYVICTREYHCEQDEAVEIFFFERYDDYSRVMDKCTENYALIMDNTVHRRIADSIFWYRTWTFPSLRSALVLETEQERPKRTTRLTYAYGNSRRSCC